MHGPPPLIRLLACLALAFPLLAAAQELGPAPDAAPPNAAQLREKLKDLEAATGIDAGLQRELAETYRGALERIETALGYERSAAEYQRQLNAAPETVRRLRRQLDEVTPPAPVDERFANADLERIKQSLTQEKAALAALQSRLADAEDQWRALQARPARAQAELAAAKLARARLETELQQPPATEHERLRDARRAALLAERLALSNQIRMLEQELLSHDARLGILQAQRELLARRADVQSANVQALEELANRRSRSAAAEVAQSAEAATAVAADTPPVVQQAANANAALSAELESLVQRIEQSSRAQQAIQRSLQQLRNQFHATQRQLEIVGTGQGLGEVLRRARRALPSADGAAAEIAERQRLIAEARLRQFQLDEMGNAVDLDQQVATMVARHLREIPPGGGAKVADQLRALLADRAGLRERLALNYGRYVDQLLEANRDQEQLIAQIQQFGVLLDESLFWIASARPVDAGWWRDVGYSLRSLSEPSLWRSLLPPLQSSFRAQPLLAGGALGLAVLLVAARPRLRRQMRRIAAEVGGPRDRFGLTWHALLDTVLLAVNWPLLIWVVGWLLISGGGGPFPHAVGAALRAVGWVAFTVEAARQLCRERGLADAHFQWRPESRRALRRSLGALLAVGLPISFVISLTEQQLDELYRDSLGRLAFVIGSLVLAAVLWHALRPMARRAAERGRRLWPMLRLAAVLPVVLAGFALYGYYYTALQLEARLFTTGWLLLGTSLLAGGVLRAIRLARRRLATPPGEVLEGPPHLPEEPAADDLDLAAADDQSRTLLRTLITLVLLGGLWWIWSDLLPAFNALREVVLYQSTGAGNSPASIVLGDLLLAVLVIALTWIAARNLPGALEIGLLARLALDAGTRYAITTLCRYLILGIGLVASLQLLGLRWSQTQWLVAALGVGLGFGLQEIFANFVSGLILLFERPVRVGDTVTLGDLSGTVTRIRIRATTVRDGDQREIIIPNKAFITDRLINWTLSDQVSRVVLRLDVAFGAAPEQVRQLLLAAARAHPRVLAEPEPFAFLVALGDAGQRFELHVFVRELAHRMSTAHDLYTTLQERLAAAGIGLSFPHRDLRVRRGDDPLGEPS